MGDSSTEKVITACNVARRNVEKEKGDSCPSRIVYTSEHVRYLVVRIKFDFYTDLMNGKFSHQCSRAPKPNSFRIVPRLFFLVHATKLVLLLLDDSFFSNTKFAAKLMYPFSHVAPLLNWD